MTGKVIEVTAAKVIRLGADGWEYWTPYVRAEWLTMFFRSKMPGFVSGRWELTVRALETVLEDGRELFVIEERELGREPSGQ